LANFVFIATSLDGFIADKNGGIDWLHEVPNPTGSDYGYNAFIESIDALVMGRNTYEKVLSFDCDWPYTKKVFVLSNTLKEVDASMTGKAEVISGDLKDIVEELKGKGFKNLYIDGGKTIQAFLNEGLIDELTINRIPILLGGGILLFGNLDDSLKLEHCSTEILGGGMVKSHYKK
jgi:dihydrofolate reductase